MATVASAARQAEANKLRQAELEEEIGKVVIELALMTEAQRLRALAGIIVQLRHHRCACGHNARY